MITISGGAGEGNYSIINHTPKLMDIEFFEANKTISIEFIKAGEGNVSIKKEGDVNYYESNTVYFIADIIPTTKLPQNTLVVSPDKYSKYVGSVIDLNITGGSGIGDIVVDTNSSIVEINGTTITLLRSGTAVIQIYKERDSIYQKSNLVYITIQSSINIAPKAISDSVTVDINSSNNNIVLKATDDNNDTISYTIVSSPTHGRLDISNIPNVTIYSR